MRDDRLHPPKGIHADQRRPGERDRDRILYSPALRRLGGVSQVASAVEGHIYHNRLTHTYEVAQISLRLAQHLKRQTSPEILKQAGDLDPDVAEAAALAHDLGHPPFGHLAELELRALLKNHCNVDSFDGNAQSFRIVTKLEFRHDNCPGLNLTRATLAAILKYPIRDLGDPGQNKWGAYTTETKDFDFARALLPAGDHERSIEAEIMDFSDDIAYSVHDVEDFYRARLIPMHSLILDGEERSRLVEGIVKRFQTKSEKLPYSQSEIDETIQRVFAVASLGKPLTRPYSGSGDQRSALKAWTSLLIGRFLGTGITVKVPSKSSPRRVELNPETTKEIFVLKQLNWYYVIETPSLLTQQIGQRTIIRTVFNAFMETGRVGGYPLTFPEVFRSQLPARTDSELARIVADMISSMTEQQIIDMYDRITGHGMGSIVDVVLRG